MPGGQPWQYRDMPFPVEKGKFLWFGTHPSGYGYIRIVTFDGRDEIADEFDRALEELKDTPGLIIDIRDNVGGSGASQSRIIGRLITARTKVADQFSEERARTSRLYTAMTYTCRPAAIGSIRSRLRC